MKIVIAGAGAVGSHLAQLFSRERHDILVIDQHPEKLSALSDHYDLLTKAISPTSIEGIRSMGKNGADLFIGVTPDETANITACLLARQFGARQTVARVESYEYLQKENQELFRKVGIDALILPEMIAAQEIVSSLKSSWIRGLWEVEDSELVLIGVKVRNNSKIVNIPLRELCGPKTPYLIVALKRGDETIIPHGNDVIKPYDLLYFMTMKAHLPLIKSLTGKDNYPDVKRVAIMGGGRTSLFVARMLPDYMRVKIIEKDPARLNVLAEKLPDRKRFVLVKGDGRDVALLHDENIDKSDAFVALTPNSETNILGCLTAKSMKILKSVAMLDNMSTVPMAESLDIGTLINKQSIAASYIYQMILKADVNTVKNLTVANADVAEFCVKPGAKVTKHLVRELRLPVNSNLGGLVRNGQSMLIDGNTQIQEGDRVMAFCIGNDLVKLSTYF